LSWSLQTVACEAFRYTKNPGTEIFRAGGNAIAIHRRLGARVVPLRALFSRPHQTLYPKSNFQNLSVDKPHTRLSAVATWVSILNLQSSLRPPVTRIRAPCRLTVFGLNFPLPFRPAPGAIHPANPHFVPDSFRSGRLCPIVYTLGQMLWRMPGCEIRKSNKRI